MTAVVGQVMRCTLAQMNKVKNLLEVLPDVELAINFFTEKEYWILPIFEILDIIPQHQLICCVEMKLLALEQLLNFCKRMKVVWMQNS